MVRKLVAAVETGRNRECTPELVWAWTEELRKAGRTEKLRGGFLGGVGGSNWETSTKIGWW